MRPRLLRSPDGIFSPSGVILGPGCALYLGGTFGLGETKRSREGPRVKGTKREHDPRRRYGLGLGGRQFVHQTHRTGGQAGGQGKGASGYMN